MECAFYNIAQGRVILTSLSTALLHSRTINTRSPLCGETSQEWCGGAAPEPHTSPVSLPPSKKQIQIGQMVRCPDAEEASSQKQGERAGSHKYQRTSGENAKQLYPGRRGSGGAGEGPTSCQRAWALPAPLRYSASFSPSWLPSPGRTSQSRPSTCRRTPRPGRSRLAN